ncbi:ABC transporter substrate-binding protein [Undibacterium pigrum]|uniref:NitT/TauT family transport system substrate-binding protein n=1 Tax=Undibacterium pigrum TaxID=401470 RepID=A0A318JER5_9BURK|nr:NrtA/SsuA/CpmA family ABC transporter substrate-binding protein [Undibacterium pigrum]PXX46997.1 NitT/TauT family transport system substrate-binding protein [Undibacterium pigrum]
MTSVKSGRLNFKTVVVWFACLLLAVLLSGLIYLGLTRSATPSGSPLEQVIIATNTEYVGTCSITTARERGYFAKEGIVVLIQSHSTGKAAMEAVLQGHANLGTVADIPVMFAGLDQRPVSVIATIFKNEKDHGIIGRRDRGILEPANLKGKRVGVTLSTSGHFTLSAFLNRQKLSVKDVTMINYKPEEFADAIERGEVDAVASWEPFLNTMLNRLGSNGVAFYGKDVYESLYNVVGMRSYISSQPETIRKVLRALDQGSQYCNEMPDAARAIHESGKKSNTKDQKAAWATYRFEIGLDQGLLLALEDQARWAIKNKLTNKTEVPNYLDYVYLDGMEKIKPAAVTIIH